MLRSVLWALTGLGLLAAPVAAQLVGWVERSKTHAQ
jgi:hypothetical protein